MPAGWIATFIGRLTKHIKWDRKKLIINQASIDREQSHHHNNISATKCHLHDVSKFLSHKINQLNKIATKWKIKSDNSNWKINALIGYNQVSLHTLKEIIPRKHEWLNPTAILVSLSKDQNCASCSNTQAILSHPPKSFTTQLQFNQALCLKVQIVTI